jgi:glycosyltransferase involved in cell wall biosynthesis
VTWLSLIITLNNTKGIKNKYAMTKLSILLCAHCPNANYDDLIVKAIRSIYEQSYKDYKLFIVLDECWSGTLSKVKDVITPDTEIIIRNKKEGLARAKKCRIRKNQYRICCIS